MAVRAGGAEGKEEGEMKDKAYRANWVRPWWCRVALLQDIRTVQMLVALGVGASYCACS